MNDSNTTQAEFDFTAELGLDQLETELAPVPPPETPAEPPPLPPTPPTGVLPDPSSQSPAIRRSFLVIGLLVALAGVAGIGFNWAKSANPLHAPPLVESHPTSTVTSPGKLRLETTPLPEQVWVDGQPWQAGQSLPPGSSTVRLEAAGYAPVETGITIQSAQTTILRGRLSPLQPPPTPMPPTPTTPTPTSNNPALILPAPPIVQVTTGTLTIPTLNSETGTTDPKSYLTLNLVNDHLTLTLLPQLGGRLYQITDHASGQPLLYNSQVIRPTHWGPPDKTGWLLAGGIEWAFPVAEHGYGWGEAWAYDAFATTEAAIARLWWQDSQTRLTASVVITLPAQTPGFDLQLTALNQSDSAQPVQFWWNAALPAGDGMAVDFPIREMVIHNLGPPAQLEPGDRIPWSTGLSRWGSWNSWFSAFAAGPILDDRMTLFGAGASPGLTRSADPNRAPGMKLVVMAADSPPVAEWGEQPYLEVWGGMNPTFDPIADHHLAPGDTYQWSEQWTLTPRKTGQE